MAAVATMPTPDDQPRRLTRSPSSLPITSVADLQALAGVLYRGGLTPPGIDSPEKVATVVLMGLEVGLAPTQALSSIMLTNGKLSIYGDAGLALVRANGVLESIEEWVDGEGEQRTGHCKAKRKGEPERHYKFTVADANRAGLIEKGKEKDQKGRRPWVAYQDRMLVYRARGFLLRDHFPDILRGLITYEEAMDAVDTEVTVVSVNGVPVEQPPATVPVTAPQLPAAAPVTAPVAPPVTQAPAQTAAPGPVTDAQKEAFFSLRALVCAAKGAHTKEEQAAAWCEALAPFGVTSIGQMNRDQAAAAIETLEKAQNPF